MEKAASTTYEPWRLFLLAGLLLTAGYVFIPDAAMRNLVYNPINTLVCLVSGVTVLSGVRRHRPVHKLPWFLLALSLLAFAAGDATITVYENLLSVEPPFPSIADVFYLAVYPALVAALLMIRSRSAGNRDGSDLIDPIICIVGITVLGLVYFMEPYANSSTTSQIQLLIGFVYMIMDILLSFSLVRFAFVAGDRHTVHHLLGLSMMTLLVTEVLYTIFLSSNMYEPGNLVDLGWLLFPIFLGCAALNPSMTHLFEPAPRQEAVLTRRRLAMLAGASLIPSGIFAIQAWRGVDFNVALVFGGSILTFSLTILRLAGLMRTGQVLKVL